MTHSPDTRILRRSRPAVRVPRLLAVSLLAVALAGCQAHGRRGVAGWLTSDPATNHPILVDRKEVVLDIEAPRGSYGLTYNQKNDLRGFLYRFGQEDSGGIIVVRAPSGSRNEIAAHRALQDVRGTIRRAGIPARDTSFESYFAGGQAAAPVRVSYMRHEAVGPECGDWSDNLVRDPRNRPYKNLGCATQRNLAAMVSNPRDLIEPRGTTPRSSERRDTVWDKYVKGETTGSEKADEEKSSISDVEGGGQ